MCHSSPFDGHHKGFEPLPKFFNVAIIGPPFIEMPLKLSQHVINVNCNMAFREGTRGPFNPISKSNYLTCGALISWANL